MYGHATAPAPTPLPPMYPGGMRIGTEEEAAVIEVLRSKRLFRYYGPQAGPSKVDEFEAAFGVRMGSPHCVAMASGTAALLSGLAALGVGPGDEVIVPAYTWISSASAVVAAGAVPVVAEVDASLTLDVDDIARKITPHTKAIMPVHMRGAPCRMDRIMEIARRHGLSVIEDVAQALGGSFGGQPLGSIGDVGSFSFQFNKIITAGEGGMAITRDDRLHKRLLLYHDVAAAQRNQIPREDELPGLTLRMSEIHGAILQVQLRRLDGLLADMRSRQRAIKGALEGVAERAEITFRTINDPAGDTGLAVIFFTREASRARRIADALNACRLGATVLFDPAVVDYHVYTHWQAIVERRSWSTHGGPWRHHPRSVDYSPGACSASLALLSRAVHLDVSPDLTREQLDHMTDTLLDVLRTTS